MMCIDCMCVCVYVSKMMDDDAADASLYSFVVLVLVAVGRSVA